ncbi:hypothetical protein SANTM175S_02399 [Streptomyces antimycoticus]
MGLGARIAEEGELAMPLRPTPDEGGTVVAFFSAASYASVFMHALEVSTRPGH